MEKETETRDRKERAYPERYTGACVKNICRGYEKETNEKKGTGEGRTRKKKKEEKKKVVFSNSWNLQISLDVVCGRGD